jgi:CheY-like chemotaxis protein
MLSTLKIEMPVSSTNEQSMIHQEETKVEYKNARNNFSKQDDLSHALRTPLHVLGGYVAGLEKFLQGFGQLRMPGPTVRINLFRRSARLGHYLSTIQAQNELLANGNYVEFFQQTRLSSEQSDNHESSIAVFREALASMTSHINHLQLAQEKLKTLICHYDKLTMEELKNQFDEITIETQTIVSQIKKEVDVLNGTLPVAVNAPLLETKKNQQRTPLRILIVDDMPANRTILARLLGKQHCCEFASNGQEAVEKYSENNFDIIFMDIQMPVMDGLQATVAIRQHELATNKRRIPIIASTAIDSATLEKGITVAAGMDGYIMKPYDQKRVREIIHLHTEKSEKVYAGNESDMDEIPLTPTFPRRKISRNGSPVRSKSAPAITNSRVVSPGSDPGPLRFRTMPTKNSELVSALPRRTPSDGRGLLAKFHLLGHENRGNLAPVLLAKSDVMAVSSPVRKSFL